MPELPEVETIRLGLLPRVLGKEIVAVHLSQLKLLRGLSEEAFVARLKGNSFSNIVRRGKYLAFLLRAGGWLVFHLGMTGRLLLKGGERADLLLTFSDGTVLNFKDRRRLGRILLVEGDEGLSRTLGLGLEPLSEEFNPQWLKDKLSATRQEIKSFLIDQSKIAGLGNIYACEALFYSRIHPQMRCHLLDEEEVGRLYSAILEVLRAALKMRGTSFSDYVDVEGIPGSFQDFLKVYGREGEGCPRCGEAIKRVKHRGRSSYFCPRCQSERAGQIRANRLK